MVDAGVGTVAKKLEESTRLRLSYLWNHKSNLEEVKKEVERVRDVRADLLSSMERADRRGEQIENDVERWLKNVEECINNATMIIEDFEGRAGIRCCKGLCPDLTTRYRLIRKSVKELKAVSGLLKDRNFDRVSYVIHQRDIWSRYSKDYETFESILSIFNDIYNALCNDDTNMIGVYGMGGIGKTALVKQVAWQAKEDKLFDEVVLALVSPTPDIRKIQGDIANQLGLQFHEENESGRARRLRDRLNQEKRFLLIFDDIWEILDLERVGIPLGNDHQGCKIMLTSRIHDVSGKMGSQCNFLVAALKEEEPFSLFKNIVGDSIESFEFQSLAIEFVKACGGLPIAIVNIANSLRGKSLFEWREAFQTLSHPSSRKFTRMLEDVCSTIELSYYHLENEELKSIFLLCGLINYTDEASVMDLLKYGTGLGLFKGIITLEETRDKLNSLVHELKSSCLLLDGHNREWFSMHAIVRYVALSIVYRDQHVSALRIKTIPKDWLNRDTVKSCNAICSHDGDISELTEGLEYPEVEFVYLNLKYSISKIPDNFFSGMTKLSVLSLTKVHLVPLPSSLHLLINLRTLCFNQCVLGDLAGIGDLKKLEILSLVCLDIEHLPREIGQLTKLRLFDLSNCSNLKAISSNVISSLSLLEELYMGNSIVEWAYEGINNERNVSLHELKFLSLLTTLELHIRDAKLLPVGLFPKKLKRYKIYIGDEWDWHDKYEYKRTLKLKLNTNIGLENEIVMQLKEIEELYLDEVQGVKNVLYDLDAGGLPKLKHLSIQNNPYIRCIVDSVEWLPCDAFPLLESLFLRNLINLEKICHGELTATFFSNLRMIKVRNCDKLRDFLSISVFRGLPKLQNFELIKCKNMEEIFTIERESEKIVIGTWVIRQQQSLAWLLPQLSQPLLCTDLSHNTAYTGTGMATQTYKTMKICIVLNTFSRNEYKLVLQYNDYFHLLHCLINYNSLH
ncbi:disease resistance protein At4g27190-like [Mangifera indica]|uniref:disease resistance protein At4g27190-like n=1 Tax=Mangifera indica TaxID=29780 RepID=UPI001CFB2C70|nr:disease resistance protein At4g27190-like [Mangifera indica]XP_044466458.1 disease resistance protein At4g27190-like [Mangifera indica]XP_044466459.1 disease resistance protein At4g27190-like [Mangifera indica]